MFIYNMFYKNTLTKRALKRTISFLRDNHQYCVRKFMECYGMSRSPFIIVLKNSFISVITFTHVINTCKCDYITHFWTVANEVSLQCSLNKLQFLFWSMFCIIYFSILESIEINESNGAKWFNPFHATGLFLYSLKKWENQRFSDVFMGYRKRPVAWHGLKEAFFTSNKPLVFMVIWDLTCIKKEYQNFVFVQVYVV